MRNLIAIVIPWLCGVGITLFGQWWELRRFAALDGTGTRVRTVGSLYAVIMGNLILMAMLPNLLFAVFGSLLPLYGVRAGIGLAITVFVFGILPARIFDRRTGTISGARIVHRLLFDLVRPMVCFALAAYLAEPWY